MEDGLSSIEAMDLTSLLFLLFPYEDKPGNAAPKGEDQQQAGKLPEGLINEVAQYYNWDAEQIAGLERVRQIRNNATHDDCDENSSFSQQEINSGKQEKRWLRQLEQKIQKIKPSFSLQRYQEKLLEEICQLAPEAASPFDDLKLQNERIRAECQKIWKMELLHAPLGEPLSGAVPWAVATQELQEMPWPSQQVQQGARQLIPSRFPIPSPQRNGGRPLAVLRPAPATG